MKNLSAQKIKYFEELFVKKQQNIIKSYQDEPDEIDVDGGDEIDVAQGFTLKNVADSLSQRDLESLNRIKSALIRIENGTFGLCEECEEPIPEKRLLALPDCTSCISCAEVQEKVKKQYAFNKIGT